LLRGLDHRQQHARNRAVVVADGTERKAEECLLEDSSSIQKQPTILDEATDPGLRSLESGSKNGPSRGPARPHVLTERCRVLGATNRQERVVVKLSALGSPGDREWKARLETQARASHECGGPTFNGSERARTPILTRDDSSGRIRTEKARHLRNACFVDRKRVTDGCVSLGHRPGLSLPGNRCCGKAQTTRGLRPCTVANTLLHRPRE